MIRALALMLAIVAAASVSSAQPSPQQPPPADAAVPAPESAAIPVPEVMGRASATEDELRKIEAFAAPDPVVASIASELATSRDAMNANAAEMHERLRAEGALRNLSELENRWLLERSGLDSWDKTLTGRSRQIEERISRLDELEQIWRETRAEMIEAKAPAAVLERIDNATVMLANTRAAVEKRRADVLDTQAEIAALVEVVNDSLALIDTERGEIASRLFGTDAPTLWALLVQGQVDAATRERELRELRRDLDISLEYTTKRADRIALHAALILLGAFALRIGKRRAAGLHAADVRDAVEILDRPFSGAVLFGLLLSPLVYETSPSMFRAALGLFGLIPLLRLVPRLLPDSAQLTFRLLAVVFFVEVVRTLIVPAVSLERVVYVAELVFALGIFARLLRPARLVLVGPHERFLPFAATAIRVVIGILGLAVVSNLIGSTELSVILGQGVLRSIYSGLAAVVVYHVFVAIVALAYNSEAANRLNMVRRHRPLMVRRTERLFRAALILGWVIIALHQFDIREEAVGFAGDVLSAQLEVGELSLSPGSALRFALVLFVAVNFSRLLRFVLQEDVLPRMSLPRGVPNAITATIHYSILFAGVIAAITAMGIDLGKFSVLAGALGVGVGFGLQTVVGNFVAGLILLFERPIQPGDVIEVGTLLGEVRHIGIRASTVRTFDGAEVIVPNASLISDQVVNWTLSDRTRRVDVKVGVKYGTDPEVVLALLVGVATSSEKILKQPAPDAQFLAFGESSLDFQLRAWTAHYSEWQRVRSDLNVAVNRALAEAQIEIPFPQRDLHVRSVSEGVGAAWNAPGGPAKDPES